LAKAQLFTPFQQLSHKTNRFKFCWT